VSFKIGIRAFGSGLTCSRQPIPHPLLHTYIEIRFLSTITTDQLREDSTFWERHTRSSKSPSICTKCDGSKLAPGSSMSTTRSISTTVNKHIRTHISVHLTHPNCGDQTNCSYSQNSITAHRAQ
jgi:hypothetical protein